MHLGRGAESPVEMIPVETVPGTLSTMTECLCPIQTHVFRQVPTRMCGSDKVCSTSLCNCDSLTWLCSSGHWCVPGCRFLCLCGSHSVFSELALSHFLRHLWHFLGMLRVLNFTHQKYFPSVFRSYDSVLIFLFGQVSMLIKQNDYYPFLLYWINRHFIKR